MNSKMFFNYIYFISLQFIKESITVNINGPKYVKRHASLFVICTTTVPPIGLTAEFLINGKTYTSLRWNNGGCFSATRRSICPQDNCYCSADGRTFTQKIVGATHDIKLLEIKCSMKFYDTNPVVEYGILTVNILDIIGPNIVSLAELPLNKGSTATFKCIVETTLEDAKLVWDCMGAHTQPDNSQDDTTVLVSIVQFQARFSDNGKECQCIVETEYLNSSSSIKLDVLNIPVIKMENTHTCNRSSYIVINCNTNDKSQEYSFDPWIHTFNGKIVRSLNGNRFMNGSKLEIASCDYQDIGNYTCVLWNNNSTDRVYGNKTTTLMVDGPPMIVDFDIHRSTFTTISVSFFTTSEPFNIQWYFNDRKITNSTDFDITMSERSFDFQPYNVTLVETGYTTNLIVKNYNLGPYLLVIENNFGEISHQFRLKDDLKRTTLHFNTVIWILSCVGVFIMTCTVATVLLGCRNWDTISRRERHRTTGNTSPADQINNYVYDRPEPHYEGHTNYSSTRHYSEIQPTRTNEPPVNCQDKDGEIHQYMEIL